MYSSYKKIAHLHIHVERAIGQVKDFHILQHTLTSHYVGFN